MTTQLYRFLIMIELEQDGGEYTAYSPTLPGCFTRAATFEDAKRRIRRIIEERVESHLVAGEPVRQSENLIHVEELTVSVRSREPGSQPSDGTPPAADRRSN